MKNSISDDELLLAYINDELEDAEISAVVARLQKEPDLAERLIYLAADEGRIVEWARSNTHIELGLNSKINNGVVIASKTLENDSKQKIHTQNSWGKTIWLCLVVVALFISSIWLLPMLSDTADSESTPNETVTIELIKLSNCVWHDVDDSIQPGKQIELGKVLNMKSGLAELRYSNGVHMILEGTGKLELKSDKHCLLHNGQLSVIVPDSKIGFSVLTPTLNILDLGTQFGVRVDAIGNTTVHVFRGEVETQTLEKQANLREKQLLTMAQAAKFNQRGKLVSWVDPDYEGFSGANQGLAGVISTGKHVRILSRVPNSLEQGSIESNSHVFLVQERQNVVLTEDTIISSLRSRGSHTGSYRSKAVLPAGTKVDSYLLHFDPSESQQLLDGSICFDRPIVGIVAQGELLIATDKVFGNPQISYEQNPKIRGLDAVVKDQAPDVLNFHNSIDRLSIRFSSATGSLDQVRILVQSAPE